MRSLTARSGALAYFTYYLLGVKVRRSPPPVPSRGRMEDVLDWLAFTGF